MSDEQIEKHNPVYWLRSWRFDMLFTTLTKLGFVGTIVTLMDSRNHSFGVEFYNSVFLELYTIFITTKSKKGRVKPEWIYGLIAVQSLCAILNYFPCHLSFYKSCWSLDECTSEGGARLIDLGIFVLSVLILLTYAVTIASSAYTAVFLIKTPIKSNE